VKQGELASALRDAVEAEDAERVRNLVAQASERDRRAAAKNVGDRFESLRWSWDERLERKRRAAVAAWLGTATARQITSDWWFLLRGPSDDRDLELFLDVLTARGRSFVETVARNTVADGVQAAFPLVRRGLKTGLLVAPDDVDAYIRGMVAGLGAGGDADATYRALLADPELLDEELWRIFEIDCSTELTNAHEWKLTEAETIAGKGENRWHGALLRLSAEGRLDRQRLLDASLDALLRDFRPSMVGWYAKLHEALEPSEDERRQRIDGYLSLLTSPVPAVIKEGLAGLRAVEHAVSADDLARAAAGPLSQKQKNLAIETLRLLERAAEREPEARTRLLHAAALALGHERTDVQERALALLERYADEAPRAELLGVAEAVAPQLRGRAQALTGIAPEPELEPLGTTPPDVPPPEPVQPRMTVERLRSDGTPLEPVASVDELIELAAFLLEGQGTGDDVERLLDGVSRLCDQRAPGFERRSAGLKKRVDEHVWWQFGSSGGDAVAAIVAAWVTGRRRPRGLRPPTTLLGFLAERALEVAARGARGQARPLLAFPTHAGGWIDPDVLAWRERAFGRIVNRPGPADQLQARVRASPPPGPLSYTRRLVERRVWNHEERLLELRPHRIPDELGRLADRVAGVGVPPGESIWLKTPAWGSWDALGARWCLTVLPSHPEIAFAGAASLIAASLEASPQLHPEAIVEHAIDPTVPLGETAWLAIGGALVAKSPDLRRVATDALVASIADGRFDPDAAGEALAWLADARLAKVSRLEAPLRDAGRVSERHAAQVVRLVEALLANLAATPHGLHAPLEPALEHATSVGYVVERPDARAALERIAGEVSSSSKLGRLARDLLATAPATR
jgi:hypothetical protein